VHKGANESGRGIRLVLVLAWLLLLPHCSGVVRETETSSTTPEQGDFSREIALLEEQARSGSDPLERAVACRRLAALLSSAKNPSPDYPRALEELNRAVELDPKGSGTDAVRDRFALLSEIDRLIRERDEMRRRVGELTREHADTAALREKTADENSALGRENRELRAAMEESAKERRELKATVERLTRENDELRNIVDQLKNLDIELEEKRKSLR